MLYVYIFYMSKFKSSGFFIHLDLGLDPQLGCELPVIKMHWSLFGVNRLKIPQGCIKRVQCSAILKVSLATLCMHRTGLVKLCLSVCKQRDSTKQT